MSNPLYDHLVRRLKWPSVAVTVGLFVLFVIGGAVLILTIKPTYSGAFTYFTPDLLTGYASILIFLISPMISGVVSALTTANETRTEAFTLLQVAGISKKRIREALFRVALIRLRLLWVVCYGLVVLLLIALWSRIEGIGYWYDSELVSTAFGIWLCGLILGTARNWLAVCIGVRAGINWRSIPTAIGVAIGMALLDLVAFGVLVYVGGRMSGDASSIAPLIVCLLAASVMYFGMGTSILNGQQTIRYDPKT